MSDVFCYIARGKNGYKIGKSKDPVKRMLSLRTSDPTIKLIYYGNGATESFVHAKYKYRKIAGEWYKLKRSDIEDIMRMLRGTKNMLNEPILTDIKEDSENYEKKLEYVIPFGKYKGVKISLLTTKEDLRYVEWLLKNTNKKNTRSKWYKIFKWWYYQMV